MTPAAGAKDPSGPCKGQKDGARLVGPGIISEFLDLMVSGLYEKR